MGRESHVSSAPVDGFVCHGFAGVFWPSAAEPAAVHRNRNALTQFKRHKEEEITGPGESATFPRWSLLSGELEETARDVVVRFEVPGMDKDDCQVTIEGNTLFLSGEKRLERETHDSAYHVMERAYGAFQRSIPLPCKVNIDTAQASTRMAS